MSWNVTYGTYTDWNTDNIGWTTTTARYVIPASGLSQSGGKVRVKLSYRAGDWAFAKCYIGHQGVGDSYDFDGNQVQLLFSGSAGATVSVGGLVSDEVTFDLDSTKNLVISFYFSGDTGVPERDDTAGYELYYKSGDDAVTTDATGYSPSSQNGKRHFIEKIEVEETGGTVIAEPLSGTLSLSGDVVGPASVTAEPLELVASLSGDVTLIPRTLFNGTLTLINSLKVGGTLTLINSLNAQVTGSVNLINNILQKIEGTLTLRNDIEEYAKFNGTLKLINHILDADSGITQGDYYFLESHGI